jgi:hypothetical protein
MPKGRERRASQRETVVDATCVGGSAEELPGRFILAVRSQVEDLQWVADHCNNAGLVLQCVSKKSTFKYPAAISQLEAYTLDPLDKSQRQAMLDAAEGPIADALGAGKDVVAHCGQSFYGTPIAVAAVVRRLTGASAQVCY